MFKLNLQGVCETCESSAKDAEILCCHYCKSFFHALCNSEAGILDGIAKKTYLNLHKQASTKSNFIWVCDTCLTQSEMNEVSTVKEMMSQLMDRFNNLESQVSHQIKSQVTNEFEKLTKSHEDKFKQLSNTIEAKVAEPVDVGKTVWNNSKKVAELRSSLLVKSDEHGNPVSADKVKTVIMDNGIQVNKVVVSSTGDTFINLPSQASRDRLRPLLESEVNKVVSLKAKLPTVCLFGVVDDLTKDQIKNGICKQNEVIGDLVKAGQELTVIYTRPPPPDKSYYQVVMRVSSDIRSAMRASGHKIYLCKKVCDVADSFHIRRCNKCQAFGHYASTCKEDTPIVCGYCGENHNSDDCLLRNSNSHSHKCCNCELAGLDSEGHNTFYRKCPAYCIQQDKLKSSIAYDYSLN